MACYYKLIFAIYVIIWLSFLSTFIHCTKLRQVRQISLHTLSTTPLPDAKHPITYIRQPISSFNLHGSEGSIVEKFQVNKNSIIRTHDSRALGAKYLNETDLPSNEDCVHWCWNTTNCNLAVYEEKVNNFVNMSKLNFSPHLSLSRLVVAVICLIVAH